jgi:Tfp pilus assembly PilM family ATPase
MFFNSSTQVIALIKRGSVTFLFKDGKSSELALPAELVQNLEVLDGTRLFTAFSEHIKPQAIKNKHVLIILDDSVVFTKVVPVTPDLDIKKIREDFLSKVPYETLNRTAATLVQEKQVFLFAANQALYQPLIQAFEQSGNKVTAVTPAAVYDLPKTKKYTKEQLGKLFEKNANARTANFLL